MKLEEMFVQIPWWSVYAVSNYGRVINLQKEFELNQRVDRTSGRMIVRFYGDNGYEDVFVDDLVVEAFFVNGDKDLPIFYKNRNKRDCTVLNLTFDPKYKEEDG